MGGDITCSTRCAKILARDNCFTTESSDISKKKDPKDSIGPAQMLAEGLGKHLGLEQDAVSTIQHVLAGVSVVAVRKSWEQAAQNQDVAALGVHLCYTRVFLQVCMADVKQLDLPRTGNCLSSMSGFHFACAFIPCAWNCFPGHALQSAGAKCNLPRAEVHRWW